MTLTKRLIPTSSPRNSRTSERASATSSAEQKLRALSMSVAISNAVFSPDDGDAFGDVVVKDEILDGDESVIMM